MDTLNGVGANEGREASADPIWLYLFVCIDSDQSNQHVLQCFA